MAVTTTAAGLLVYFVDGAQPVYLLLRNASTLLWEPPKGMRESRETLLACAVRECREETGLNIDPRSRAVLSPIRISYAACDTQKYVFLFPCEIPPDFAFAIRLSQEHSEYRWVVSDQLGNMHIPTNTLAACFQVTADIQHRRRVYEHRRGWRSRCLDVLDRAVCSMPARPTASWYVGGSVAASEHTVLSERVVSDVDLIAIESGNRSGESMAASVAHLRSAVADEYLEDAPWISVCRIPTPQAIKANEPFWSYFLAHGHRLGTNGTLAPSQLQSGDSPGPQTQSYNVFRLIWYFSLPDVGAPPRDAIYHEIKGVVVASLIHSLSSGRTFTSHSAHRDSIVRSLLSSQHQEEMLLGALHALDAKLGLRMPQVADALDGMFLHWAQHLVDTTRWTDDRHIAMVGALMSLMQSSQGNLAGVQVEVTRILGITAGQVFRWAASKGERTFIWLILVMLRLRIWPKETKDSGLRYGRLLRALSSAAEQTESPHFCRHWLRQTARIVY